MIVTDAVYNRILHEDYSPRAFYAELMDGRHEQITRAMDAGDESSVRAAIIAALEAETAGFEDLEAWMPQIREYINESNWIN